MLFEGASTFWLGSGWIASLVFIVAILIFFFGETVKLRIMMLGRQRMGYGVLEIIHRNGRRTLHAVKFEREIKVGNYNFKPKFTQEYVFRNEFGMPTIQFNVRSVQPLQVEETENEEKTQDELNDVKGRLERIKSFLTKEDGKKPEEKLQTIESEYQLKPNVPPKSITIDPAEDLQSHMAFYQAGILKGGGLSDKLEKMIMLVLIAAAANIGLIVYLMFSLKVF